MKPRIDGLPDLDEWYAAATRSSDLGGSIEHRTAVDYLLAAGFVARRGRRDRVALVAHRMRVTGDLACRGDVVEYLADQLARQGFRKRLAPIQRDRAALLADAVLGWFLAPNCPVCTGRRYRPVAGTPHLSTSVCEACMGTGVRPLPELSGRRRTTEHMDWLAAELEDMVSRISADLAQWFATKEKAPRG